MEVIEWVVAATLNSELLPTPLHGKHWCNGLGSTFTAGNSSETHILGFTTLNVCV